MDLISVVIPVFNVEQYLLRCIQSVQNQTYRNLEIILVDDGSPDRCPQMCDEIQTSDPRIKVVHKENGGLGYARNSGLDVVTGAYVTFIDSDDWISQTHIECLYQAAKDNQADAVIGSHTSVSADGIVQVHFLKMDAKIYKGSQIINEIVLPLIGAEVNYPQDVQIDSSSCMNLYRTDIIRTYNLRFRSEKHAVAEDLYFNIDFFVHAKQVIAVNEVGYYYYENQSSISRKYDQKRFERTLNFYKTIQSQVAQYGLEDMIAWRAERSFLMKIRVAIRHIVLSDIPRKEKIDEIKQILSHDVIKSVLQEYPIETYVPAMRLLVMLMRFGSASGVYYLMILREAGKKTTILRSVLRHIGIGK